ncbi:MULTISPECIES: sulfite exporter TauE/SafE family protein [Streptococcus]|uniref:sulfite exporter TauE/SafE family protein n=1 Tax=Streptococcus TaxID=1301 RepID=UPI000CF4AF0E|nr:sulfite exporter TauE/SafE family protein [Streptococcus suis]MDG3135742.1 sulfite exporter TauE/SafE family protein [Streptococcus suis]HEL1541394.1 sulfite exporter TauE/SafE family protein [Streptococcus suis]HEL1543087.1 sulfite exporter TauE/SafE family protein [Streptococcus suis]HEM3633994.1 sulfite exporter TauE/SafE family protein [Streptococcus suis]
MSFKDILLLLVIVVNAYFAVVFIKDLILHKNEVMSEEASTVALPFSSAIIFFLSTVGISDFAISTSLYPKLNWTSVKKLPGTLNTQCTIPVAVMALAYITKIEVSITTLIVCIVSQMVGSYFGAKFAVKLPAEKLKVSIGIGMIVAALIIFGGKFGLLPGGGNATELTGIKLVVAAVALAIFGALNNIGIGSYALTMITVYLLGLNPAVAFPIMMGAATFSVPVGSVQFVKSGEYSRKITLFTSTFGVLGVLCAVFVITSLNTAILQWFVAFILLYSAYGMLKKN